MADSTENLIKQDQLVFADHLAYITNGNPDERTMQRRIKTVSEKCKDYNILECLQKNDTNAKIRSFNLQAAKKVKILDDFLNGKQMTPWQIFCIATNLSQISSGLNVVKASLDLTEQAMTIRSGIVSYVRKMKFKPLELKHFSPYKEDWVYKDIIQAESFKDRNIVLKERIPSRSLKEGENELAKVMQSIKESKDCFIHVIRAVTGLGKTELFLDWEGSSIALPNHQLINEASARMKIFYDRTLPVPKLINKENQEKLTRYYKIGASNKARELLRGIIDSHPKNVYCIDPDFFHIDNYLHYMKLSKYTSDTLLTTHSSILNQSNKNHTIIFDEDPLQTSLLPVSKVFLSDLQELLRIVKNAKDRKIVESLIDLLLDTPPNKITKMSAYAFENYFEIEELVSQSKGIIGNILGFINSTGFVRTDIKKHEYQFILKNPLPEDKQVVILSATAEEWIYRKMYGDRVKFYDISNIEHLGKLMQDSKYTYSKSNLTENDATLEYAKKIVGDKIVVTFKDLLEEFDNGSKDVYFFKSTGYDMYKGKDIAVVGTPHLPKSTYLLYADALGLNFRPKDYAMSERIVERNGLEFKIFTFENSELRDLQLHFIESEIIQAGGRARTIRMASGSVLFLTNFGIPGAEQLN